MKRVIKLILASLLGGLMVGSTIYMLTNKSNPTYVDCGVVKSKSADEVAIKHGVTTELYLNIHFKNSGFRAVKVNPTTYFGAQKNEIICFHLNKETTFLHKLLYSIGMISIIVFSFTLIVLFICWLFDLHI